MTNYYITGKLVISDSLSAERGNRVTTLTFNNERVASYDARKWTWKLHRIVRRALKA